MYVFWVWPKKRETKRSPGFLKVPFSGLEILEVRSTPHPGFQSQMKVYKGFSTKKCNNPGGDEPASWVGRANVGVSKNNSTPKSS